MTGNYIDFPWQRYFMNQGPWMSRSMYLVQGGALLVAGLVLFAGLRASGPPAASARGDGAAQ